MGAMLIVTFLVFATIMTAMAVGVIFGDKCLRGSCGGQEIWGPDGELLNCDSCPVREKTKAETGTQV